MDQVCVTAAARAVCVELKADDTVVRAWIRYASDECVGANKQTKKRPTQTNETTKQNKQNKTIHQKSILYFKKQTSRSVLGPLEGELSTHRPNPLSALSEHDWSWLSLLVGDG